MKTCATCIHWTHDELKHDALCIPGCTHGTCLRVLALHHKVSVSKAADQPAVTCDWDEYRSTLLTRHDFGCTLHDDGASIEQAQFIQDTLGTNWQPDAEEA